MYWEAFWVDVCVPYPREPLIFLGDANGTEVSKIQLGLYLSMTHFSVVVSNNGTYFPKIDPDYYDPKVKNQNNDSCKRIFGIDGGAYELLSFKRDHSMKAKVRSLLNFAVLLDQSNDYSVVDSGDIECFFTSKVKEEVCDGSKKDLLGQIYYDSSTSQESRLTRAWIVFDLKVLADVEPIHAQQFSESVQTEVFG